MSSDYVEPPTSEIAEPDVDPDLIDREWVLDELAWLEGTRDRAEAWLAQHGLLAAYERVQAHWGDAA